MRSGVKVVALLVSVMTLAILSQAHAETTRHTRTTTTTTIESDDDVPAIDAPAETGYAPPADALPAPKNAKPPVGAFMDAELTQTFGSTATTGMSGCKTEALSKGIVQDLKRECSSWAKEQKADLGSSYLGNTCEDSCDDCGMTLVRCKVTGTVRYRKTVGEIDAK